MIVAIVGDVMHVDEPARCAALHSPWDLSVREWSCRLKSVKHQAYSRDHECAELLGAGFEGNVLGRGSRGVVAVRRRTR